MGGAACLTDVCEGAFRTLHLVYQTTFLSVRCFVLMLYQYGSIGVNEPMVSADPMFIEQLGETGRTLAMRMKDHLILRNPLTAVAEHSAHEHHKITKDSVRVLDREDGWLKRKLREAIKIKIGQPAMNCDRGYELPPSTMNFCCHVIVIKAVT